ncbi:MAG: 3-oxoacyl-ACP reductase FabG [Myxococcota bacterium]
MSERIGWALITGASRGIGAAIAKRLSADGWPILINYRSNMEAAESVKAEIEAAGGTARLLPFDVTDGPAVAEALASLHAEEQHVDVLVNNAGIAADNSFPTMTADQWTSVTRTTLDGFFHVTQPLVMPMVRKRRGRIINVSSVSGVAGNRGQVNYSAAKAGLIGATKALAIEVAKRGVTVNAIAPGLIETDMIEGAPIDMILKAIPMRRIGTTEEVASLVGWLASDEAGYITGQVITMAGGLG